MHSKAKIQAWHDKVKEIMEQWTEDTMYATAQIEALNEGSGWEPFDAASSEEMKQGMLAFISVAYFGHLTHYLKYIALLRQQPVSQNVIDAIHYIMCLYDTQNNAFGQELMTIAKVVLESNDAFIKYEWESQQSEWPPPISIWGDVLNKVEEEDDPVLFGQLENFCGKWIDVTIWLYKELGAFIATMEGPATEDQKEFSNDYIDWLEEEF